ncbi:prolipoprotein diacylglyceryl transferase [Actinomadura barringtoniae]|uniref:Phosphatidylglycerol--prolipoprotein diacylglyceryl transferase n=1 Tax=Actinomadura barringtoniae TaxID=1427535 RepID=A0A939PBU4_9ACTN|nr:prolipoprotein diacylglyceryl transferase [Actinomadura barringtoniae]MBO2449771.1 prolipoprotein diacylglyceryl transferase [Actinomadura barringtoniae]
MQPLASIPSPSQGVWHLGPLPIRAYALMIIIGIVVAVWVGERRWAARGGTPGVVIDVAVWAVPFGLVGGRLYHVITDYQRYFGDGKDPVNALKIWEGGLGIWGAVILGAVGAIIGCRRRGISVLALGDAIAPGIALAQAIGRWGNWWNQELYGRPLHTFWALKIDYGNRPKLPDGSVDPKYADVATYHPTFLYESLWCVGVAILVIWADRRFKLTHGRSFALYVAAYTVGRFWVEALRIDDAHHFLGLRLNDWTSIIVFLGAVGYLYWARNQTGPENVVVGGTEAPATEPGQPAAETDEPKDAEPVVADAADAEPEPEDEEPAKAEPVAEEEPPAEEEPAKAEPAKAEPAEDAAAEDATVEEEPAKAESTKDAPAEDSPAEDEPAKAEPSAEVTETADEVVDEAPEAEPEAPKAAEATEAEEEPAAKADEPAESEQSAAEADEPAEPAEPVAEEEPAAEQEEPAAEAPAATEEPADEAETAADDNGTGANGKAEDTEAGAEPVKDGKK